MTQVMSEVPRVSYLSNIDDDKEHEESIAK